MLNKKLNKMKSWLKVKFVLEQFFCATTLTKEVVKQKDNYLL